MLESAARSVNKIGDKIEEIKRTDASKLQDEYEKLVAGLQDANERREEEDMLANPGMLHSLSARPAVRLPRQFDEGLIMAVLSSDMLEEAVPGNIRKAEHFIAFLKRFIEYLKVCARTCSGTALG